MTIKWDIVCDIEYFYLVHCFRFSFEITPLGEIKCVFYLHGEHDAVLVAKKGFAALLSSKLQKAVSTQDIILFPLIVLEHNNT